LSFDRLTKNLFQFLSYLIYVKLIGEKGLNEGVILKLKR
jgi:hypothetical protein